MGVTNLQVAEPHRICCVRGTVSRNQCLGWVCIREGSDHCQHRALKPPSPSASRSVLFERVTEEPPTAGLDCQSPFTGATSQGHTFPGVWEEGRAVLESQIFHPELVCKFITFAQGRRPKGTDEFCHVQSAADGSQADGSPLLHLYTRG